MYRTIPDLTRAISLLRPPRFKLKMCMQCENSLVRLILQTRGFSYNKEHEFIRKENARNSEDEKEMSPLTKEHNMKFNFNQLKGFNVDVTNCNPKAGNSKINVLENSKTSEDSKSDLNINSYLPDNEIADEDGNRKDEFSIVINEIKKRENSNSLDILSHFVKKYSKFSAKEIDHLCRVIINTEKYNVIQEILTITEHNSNSCLRELFHRLIQNEGVEKTINVIENLIKSYTKWPLMIYKEFISTLVTCNGDSVLIADFCLNARQHTQIGELPLYHLLHCYLQQQNMNDSLKVINIMANNKIPIEHHFFWPIIVTAKIQYGEIGVFEIVDIMYRLGSYPNCETLMKYIYPNISQNNAFKKIKAMAPNKKLLQYLEEVFIKYALENGYFTECLALLKDVGLSNLFYEDFKESIIKAFLDYPVSEELIITLKTLNSMDPLIIVTKLCDAGQIEKVRETIKLFLKLDVNLWDDKKGNYLLLRQSLPEDVEMNLRKFLELPQQPHFAASFTRNSSQDFEFESLSSCEKKIESIEIHLLELKLKKMNPAGEMYKLIKNYMNLGLMPQAIRIREEFLQLFGEDVQFTPTYLSCMARLYEFEDNVKMAFHYYYVLRKKYPEFIIDMQKSAGLCKRFIQIQDFDALYDFIDRMPPKRRVTSKMQSQMVSVLKEMAKLKDPQILHSFYDRLLQRKIIKVTEVTLQPFLDVYINMDNMEEAINEFFRLTKHFERTPYPYSLLQELASRKMYGEMEPIVRKVLEMSPNNDIILATFRIISGQEDLQALDNFVKLYKINFPDYRLKHILKWECFGGPIERRFATFKTLLSYLSSYKKMGKFLARIAVEHAIYERHEEYATNLRALLYHFGFLGLFKADLDNLIALRREMPELDSWKSPHSLVRNKNPSWRIMDWYDEKELIRPK